MSRGNESGYVKLYPEFGPAGEYSVIPDQNQKNTSGRKTILAYSESPRNEPEENLDV